MYQGTRKIMQKTHKKENKQTLLPLSYIHLLLAGSDKTECIISWSSQALSFHIAKLSILQHFLVSSFIQVRDNITWSILPHFCRSACIASVRKTVDKHCNQDFLCPNDCSLDVSLDLKWLILYLLLGWLSVFDIVFNDYDKVVNIVFDTGEALKEQRCCMAEAGCDCYCYCHQL